ncbi:MAG: hypothetical protein ACHP78_01545 [Terriglobales bacterium]
MVGSVMPTFMDRLRNPDPGTVSGMVLGMDALLRREREHSLLHPAAQPHTDEPAVAARSRPGKEFSDRASLSPTTTSSTGAPALKSPTVTLGRKQNPFTESLRRDRAETVGKLIKELNILKPFMYPQDYDDLRREHPDFLCFQIAKRSRRLRLKLEYLRDHFKHVRLAQELAAARHGVQWSTIQKDWKLYKPKEFRRPRAAQELG